MKKIIFILIVVMALFLSGCDIFQSKETTNEIDYLKEINKGTDGLVVSFLPDLPSNEAYGLIGNKLQIKMKIENKGTFDVTDETSSLIITHNQEYFTEDFTTQEKSNAYRSLSLPGRSRENPYGGFIIVPEKDNLDYKISDSPAVDKDMIFTATVCYQYGTEASADICINPYIFDPQNQKKEVCEPKEITLKDGQGAPIAVTKITEQILPAGDGNVNLLFYIYIDNVGKGRVVEKTAYDKGCKGQLGIDDMNIVKITDVVISNRHLKCEGKQLLVINEKDLPKIKLGPKGENKIQCELADVSKTDGAYTAPLNIKLSYGYVESTDKVMKLKAPPKVGSCTGNCYNENIPGIIKTSKYDYCLVAGGLADPQNPRKGCNAGEICCKGEETCEKENAGYKCSDCATSSDQCRTLGPDKCIPYKCIGNDRYCCKT